jgi:uncharacterized protein YhaN
MALRIERLDFSPWGCFEDHSLPFDGTSGQVELVYGPNASGKSTTSRGERSLLYGIEVRSADGHTHAYQDLRIGARLQLDGSRLEVSRRKRRVDSLTDADGDPISEETITNALGGLSEEIYRGLFQVDHDTLVKGGAELAQGKGEIGSTLFAAAAGIATLHDTLAALEAEAERLFSPRARTTVLQKALAVLREAEKRTREATLRPTRHRDLTKALRETEQASETLGGEIREIDRQARVLERRRALAPLLDTHGASSEELNGLAGTPELPVSAAADRAGAQGRISAGSVALARARGTCERLDGELAAIVLDEPLIARGEEIALCKERASAIGKARGDRRKREGELQETDAALTVAAGVIGVSDPSEIESLRRPASAHRELDAQLSAHGELTSVRKSAQASIKDAERNLRSAREELEDAPAALDVRALEAAVTSAIRAGALGEQIENACLQAARSERDSSEHLGRLDPAPGSIELLAKLRAPSHEQAERAVEESGTLAGERADCAKERQRLLECQRELEEAQQALTLAGAAPSVEQLAHARDEREKRWVEIRAGALGDTPLGAQATHDFERSVSNADGLADRRTEHATQIERGAALQARAVRLDRELADLIGREAELESRSEANEAAWNTLWKKTGLDAITVLEAPAWLAERDGILALERLRGEQHEQAEMLRKREASHREALDAELNALHEPAAGHTTLESMLELCQGLLAHQRDDASARAGLEATVRAGERTLATAQEQAVAAEVEIETWQKQWPTWRTEAGLPGTAGPKVAQEILRAIEDGLARLTSKRDLERRIAGIDADQAEFDGDVRRLCTELAPELCAVEPERAAGALHAKLAASERCQEKRESLATQAAEAGAHLADAEADLAAAEQEITAMMGAAGVESVDELPGVEMRAARACTLRAEIAELETQIEKVGEGRFSDLAAEAESFDRDEGAMALAQLRERSEELRHERDDAKELLGNRKRELRDLEGDTAAVQGAQDVALARTAVRDAAIVHAKARLACTVVRRAIERYRRQHQDPLLDRANHLFTRFTLGSCVELFVDVDERGRGMLMSRERDRTLKRIEELSTGTCEQLFLALRIAAIERYVAAAGAVPVIFDDVFIESDEPRSQRIFEALGELAQKTQVIVLTHHLHLIDVGGRGLGANLLVQRLPDAAPTLREARAA